MREGGSSLDLDTHGMPKKRDGCMMVDGSLHEPMSPHWFVVGIAVDVVWLARSHAGYRRSDIFSRTLCGSRKKTEITKRRNSVS